MVVLIFACSTHSGRSKPQTYKVTDSNEEYTGPDHTKSYAKSYVDEGDSGGFYGSGFHFPDFFNDGTKDEDKGFGSSPFAAFPSLSESRSSDSTYIVPAGTYRTNGYGPPKPQYPISRSHSPPKIEYRNAKNSILTLYDDWKPAGEEQPRNTKWSQEHVDDDSSEVSGPERAPSQPYRGQQSYGRPYSEASLKQHYKPLRPVGNTHGAGTSTGGEFRVHQHKYGVNHVYDPKKNKELNYDNIDDNLNNRRPQQFRSNPHKNEKPPPLPSYSKEYRSRPAFSPSPPDRYRHSGNDRNFDYFSDSSNVAPKKLKRADSKHEQLDKSCVKRDKITTINMSDGNILLSCYDCYDGERNRPYEHCVQVPDRTDGKGKRSKRSVNGTASARMAVERGKRQYDEYYEGGDGNYGPADSSDYRFGPEHFTDDDTPSDDEEGRGEYSPEYESEKCYKSRKGNMLCISCENRNTGGTYEQCSYGSDPKENSYERSISKAYGSARIPENRRKQVDPGPRRPVYTKRKHYPADSPSSGQNVPRGPSRTGKYNGGGHRYEDEGPDPDYRNAGGIRGSKLTNGGGPRYRGSQGRAPLPARGSARSPNRTPASTDLKDVTRSNVLSKPRNSHPHGRYSPSRHPPPASRAYSTPSPIGPDPYSYDIPDPYSPDLSTLDPSAPTRGNRNRKNIDASFDPGYDETFSTLFPELVDSDPTSAVELAPSAYDEYTDYDDSGPVRRTDQNGLLLNDTRSTSIPSSRRIVPDRDPAKRDTTPGKKPRKSGSCKKVGKNKMTCYQCVDSKGTKHEECTYVADSEPKSKHMTYREVKETRYEPDGSRQGSQQQATDERRSEPTVDPYLRGKRKSKKYIPQEHDKWDGAREKHEESWPPRDERDNHNNPRQQTRGTYNVTVDSNRRPTAERHSGVETREKRENEGTPEDIVDSKIESATRKNYNPIPTDPPELDNFGEKMSEDGEFTADTEMKYDPDLGITLPKYMLEKSEHEADFDEFVASSH